MLAHFHSRPRCKPAQCRVHVLWEEVALFEGLEHLTPSFVVMCSLALSRPPNFAFELTAA